MSFLDAIRHRLHVASNRAAYERAIEDEMQFHLSLDAAQQGSSNVARRRFGNRTHYKEEARTAAGLATLDGARQDARHLIRSLRHSPAFTLVAVLTLALGIGTTTAVLSVVDHVLVHSLPFRDAGRLVMLLERDDRGGLRTPSAPTAADWRRDPGVRQAFEGVTFIRGDGAMLGRGDDAERIAVGFVGPEFFPLVGAKPVLGRLLTEDDQRPDAPPAAVIAYSLWQQRFGGDPGVVGRRVDLDSIPTTIIGVMPNGGTYPTFASVWEPVTHYRHQEILTRRGLHADSRTIGRLRPGVDSARAATVMRTVEARLALSYPAEQARWQAAMLPLQNEIIGNVRPMLLTLAAAVGVVLLLACANVANLLLARTASRTRELAVRSALGASRGRIMRQLLTESLLLSVAGGVVGMGLAAFAVDLARKLPPDRLPRVDELAVDQRVLIIAAAASLLTALFCGVWPAVRATRPASAETLRASTLGSVGVRGDSRLRRALVVVQFSLALVLIVGAGLLVQSFRRAADVDVGFDPRGLVTLSMFPPAGAYDTPESAAALYARLMDAARTVPGVTDAAFINHVPFGAASIYTSLQIEGRSGIDTSSNQVLYRTVSDTYLQTMKMRLAAGRWFTSSDVRAPGGSFVINRAMAKQYWPGQSALGKRITVHRASQARADFGQPLPGVVIGIIDDVHQTSLDAVPEPEVYVPYTLEPWPWGNLVVRTRDGASAIPALQRAVMSVDPRLLPKGAAGAAKFSVTEHAIDSSLAPRKLAMTLLGAFAACALVLAAIGLYGVIAYGVTQRTRELGVRKALGATDGMIAALVIRESMTLTAAGIAIGCAGAWASARLIRNLLFDTGAGDPVTYSVTIVVLVIIAFVAAYVPARRATRLDPTIAMRGE